MKKFVSVNELSFGVYVTQLDRPWTETPFVFQGFLLNSEAQLATLHKFCKSVCIDTEKGADVKSTPGYRRQDEIGTPYGITIDFETIEKDAGVTVRDRDTLAQVRMTEDDLVRFLDDKVNG